MSPSVYGWDRDHWRSFGVLVKDYWRRKKFREKGRYGALVEAWSSLAGPDMAAATSIRSFKDGELVIETDSAALLHEMNGYMKTSLLAGLQNQPAGADVARLRFCLAAGRQEER